MKVLMIIPAYNEELNIENTVKTARITVKICFLFKCITFNQLSI